MPEAQFQPDIQLQGLLPFQLGVSDVSGQQGRLVGPSEHYLTGGILGGIEVVANLGITRKAIAGAQLKIADGGIAFQERLLRQSPGRTRRREEGVYIVGAEVGRTVCPARSEEHT